MLINSSKVAREEGVNTGLRKENRALMELKEQV